MKPPDWRSPEAYKGVAHLPVRDIAWEFLRRNPSYRRAFKKAQIAEEDSNKSFIDHWGINFPVDPKLSAKEAGVCWRPERCASIIILSKIEAGTLNPSLNLSEMRGQIISQRVEDGTHVFVQGKDYSFQLFLVASAVLESSLQANIPIDDIADTRCEAVKRFYRFLIGEYPSCMPRRSVLREKYPHALQALDGCLAGASYREIAEVMFGAARIEQDSWKTSTIRSSTIRLARMGVELMRSGYKDLLQTNSY